VKRLLLIIIFSVTFLTNACADEIFNELLSAIKQDVTDAQLVGLENKYKGQIISGVGYVDDVRVDMFTKGLNISLSLEYNKYTIMSDVHIEVPEDSPYFSIAQNLNKGQMISFSGKFDDIFGRSIYIRGDVKIRDIRDTGIPWRDAQ